MSIESRTERHVLLTDLSFPESPRWQDGRLWVADWGANEVIVSDLEGRSEVVARVPSFPMCTGHLPDGRLLIVDSGERRLLRRERDGSLVTHADLAALGEHPWNDIVVDGRGNAYVNNIGFDFPAGEFAPRIVVPVTPDGAARQVADGLAFPNGMAVTPDNATLIVAESYGQRLTAFGVAADGGCPTAGPGPRSPTTPTASAWMPRVPCGTATSGAVAACACARAARSCRSSTSIAAASPACSAVRIGEPCSWPSTSGGAPRTWAAGL
jgi:sugar lactone lactonase YvrE